jgi:hypothetical protein
MRHLALLSCVALVACGLYGHNNPPDAPLCDYAPGAISGIPGPQVRDPLNGSCESFDCGCDPCGDYCPPCPAPPAWPSCTGSCESLNETQCLMTAGCHAAYLEPATTTPPPVTQQFWGCWDISPLSPIEGSCTGLDALTCVQHDNCTSLYTSDQQSFVSCNPDASPPPACSTLTTEAACKARPDCTPIYNGSNCTCDPNGCTCQNETFERCQ